MSSEIRPSLVLLNAPGNPLPYNLPALETAAEVRVTDAAGLPAALEGAQALLLWDFFSSALHDSWGAAASLEWVHVAAAGVDAVLFDELRTSDVALTNAYGIFDAPIAEYALATILAFDKQLHLSRDHQLQRIWRHRESEQTAGRKALVIGTGGIGRAVARLLRAVGMEVRGAGRTARHGDPDFGTVLPASDLAGHVGWADHVVVIAPLTDQTRGLIDAQVLGAMKESAHLVNVGRGPLVDEAALITALEQGTIAGASLDVFVQEPLPQTSRLWDLPQVNVSPHLSGDVSGWRDALADQFKENLDRWIAGQPFAQVVDKQRGYVRR